MNDPSDPNNDTRRKSEQTWIDENGNQVRAYSVTLYINAQSDDDLTKPYKVRVWRGNNRLGPRVLIDPDNLITGSDELGNEWGQTWTQGEDLGEGKDLRNIVFQDFFVDKVPINNGSVTKYYIIHYYAESVPNDNASSKAPHQVLSDGEEEINGELVICPGHYVAKEVAVEVEFNNDIPTGICSVVSKKEIASEKYVNTMGVESNTPFKGINIVVTTYSDGTTSTRKEIR